MDKNGVLHTIDINEELVDFQKRYFDKSDYGSQIIQHLGSALDIIPTIETTFDLVFMDADKPNYINYFHQIIDKLNPRIEFVNNLMKIINIIRFISVHKNQIKSSFYGWDDVQCRS